MKLRRLRDIRILFFVISVISALLMWGCDGNGGIFTPASPSIVTSEPPQQTQPPKPAITVVMIGAGDIGWCGLRGAEETATIISNTWADIVFTLGDNAYMHGSTDDFMKCYDPFWGRFKNQTRPALGNHEYKTPGASGYFTYFGLSPNQNYYSYDLGNWHVVVLDTEADLSAASTQLHWLRRDLENNKDKPVLVQQHKPLVSSGPNGDNPSLWETWRVFEEFKVKVVLAGHDHLYERFGKINSSGLTTANGIRQFIVGTGGAKLYDFATVKPGSEFRTSAWGVLRLTLGPNSYRWEFITAGQKTMDSGTESIG